MSVMFATTTPNPATSNHTTSNPAYSKPSSGRLLRSAPPATARSVAPTRVRLHERPSAAAFRRRRVVAGVLGLGLVFVTAQAAEAVGHDTKVSPVTVATIHYRVRTGDTLWSIARVVAPNDDPRAVVDLMVQARGSSVIEPGDLIDWASQ